MTDYDTTIPHIVNVCIHDVIFLRKKEIKGKWEEFLKVNEALQAPRRSPRKPIAAFGGLRVLAWIA